MKKLLQIPITSNRIFGLDIVRAAAILFVILTHSGNFIPRNWMFWYKSLIYDGVGVFFVLSGFLIGGILIKQIETYKFNFKSLLYFWSKRWSRTLPNYFLFLIILLILESFINDNFQIRQHLSYFIFSQNLTSSPPSFFLHSWSLSVEEWFYLVTPFLLFIFMSIFKFKFKYVFLITIFGIIVFVTIFRLYEIRNISNWNEFKNITYGVIYRFDSLMYGMLA
ncbi:MAG: acyltransferase [Weeksellaceae bacterium]|nr:acyltransferase [Weeksellaceae bacterium]